MTKISITKTKKYIEEHFTDNINLDDIAKVIGYSKYHLNRVFRESTNQSIYNYIRERRLHEAAYQLLNSDQSIVEIALDIGYSSQQSFTFAFKKEFECTPQVYRNNTIVFDKQEVIIINQSSSDFSNIMMYASGVIAA